MSPAKVHFAYFSPPDACLCTVEGWTKEDIVDALAAMRMSAVNTVVTAVSVTAHNPPVTWSYTSQH